MKTKTAGPVEVINVNKNGEVFDPSGYVVSRNNCPELYKLLEKRRGNSND